MIIKLPKWLNDVSIYIFFEYLKTGEIIDFSNSEVPLTDTTMQKLLWVADYFQIEELQEKCIKQCIFPKMTKENVLLFLTEATKKLNVSEDSNEIWNDLSNYSIKIASKNLLFLIKNNFQELSKFNGKLVKEIIERFIISEKNLNNSQMKEILDFIMMLKKFDDLLGLLNYQKKSIISRSNEGTYNYLKFNYVFFFKGFPPNIIWNLSLDSKESGLFFYNGFEMNMNIVFENEINVSKLNKIPKKMKIYLNISKNNNCKEEKKYKNKLKIYDYDKSGKFNDCFFNEFDFIFTFFFQIKLNGKELGESNIKIKHINPNSENFLLLCEQIIDFQKFQETSINVVTISLKIDFIYGLCLSFLSKNIDKFIQNPANKNISELDLLILIKTSKKNSNSEKILAYLNRMSL